MRSMREAWVDEARGYEMLMRGGARAQRLGRQLKDVKLRRILRLDIQAWRGALLVTLSTSRVSTFVAEILCGAADGLDLSRDPAIVQGNQLANKAINRQLFA